LNDRVDLAVLAGWDGVHVGQGDLSVEDVRRVLGGDRPATPPMRDEAAHEWGTLDSGWIVGLSTHGEEQVSLVEAGAKAPSLSGGEFSGLKPAAPSEGMGFGDVEKPTSQKRDVGHPDGGPDYLAIGPVFGTATKVDAEPVVGLEGVRRARALTRRPLVAIGGITRENARAVVEAGADSVAVIGGLFAEGETVGEVARDFLRILG
jgi:thiamine-phosphate pyrophosphorylase